jgi:hypothetical protein
VDDRVFSQYLNWFEGIDNLQSSVDDLDLIDVSPFYVFQLPTIRHPADLWDYVLHPYDFSYDESEYYEHDIAIYTSGSLSYSNKDAFFKDLRTHFITHPFIQKIDSAITPQGMRFGAYKELVRNICADVPLPYNKDLTMFVQNLYGWFVDLFPETYYIDVPGSYSQCLHKKSQIF